MKRIIITMFVIIGLAGLAITMEHSGLTVGIQKAEAAKIKTRSKCQSAKKQYKSYNRALKRQVKTLNKVHNKILKVSPNRVVGYTQEVINQAQGVYDAAMKLKAQAALIQQYCVEDKQMAEPLI